MQLSLTLRQHYGPIIRQFYAADNYAVNTFNKQIFFTISANSNDAIRFPLGKPFQKKRATVSTGSNKNLLHTFT